MKKAILILAIAAIAGCTNNSNYDATGVFEATEVTISAKVQGEITALEADEGDVVKTGDVLGTIDSKQLDLQKQQLEQTKQSTDSRKVSISAQLAALEQQCANLEREKARYEELLASKAATQKQVEWSLRRQSMSFQN